MMFRLDANTTESSTVKSTSRVAACCVRIGHRLNKNTAPRVSQIPGLRQVPKDLVCIAGRETVAESLLDVLIVSLQKDQLGVPAE